MIPFEQAKKTREDNLAQARKAAEAKIDAAISAAKDVPVIVDVGNIEDSVAASLAALYRNGGWAVDYRRSSRGGFDPHDGLSWEGSVVFTLSEAQQPGRDWTDK